MSEQTLSRRRVLSSLAVAGSSGALVGNRTVAALFDNERTGMGFAAGGVDLVVETPEGTAEGGLDVPVELTSGEDGVVGDTTRLSVTPKESTDSGSSNPVYPWVGTTCPEGSVLPTRVWVTVRYADTGELLVGGTLLEVADRLRSGVPLDPAGEGTDAGDRACLSPDESIDLVIEWELLHPGVPNGGDASLSVRFEFVGRQCRHADGTENPFQAQGGCSAVAGGISFVAFCDPTGELTSEDVTVSIEDRNDEGEPVTVAWTGDPVEYVTLFAGSQSGPRLKLYDVGTRTTGTVTSVGVADADAVVADARGGVASIPCEIAHERLTDEDDFDGTSVKLEYSDGSGFVLEGDAT